MTELLIPILLWFTLVAGLCFIVYHLSKAGGSVTIVLPIIKVEWGKK